VTSTGKPKEELEEVGEDAREPHARCDDAAGGR
jgi:hypothetical protein